MVEEGESPPGFELPGVREGEIEQVALEDVLGETVVILVFYPGDFNPACGARSTGLDDFDLFTMQKDVSVFAISGDSVFSHRAFASEYALHLPLLADVDGEVAADYGVVADEDGYLTRRAVFVIDHTEHVEYAWVADDVEDLPDVDEIRAAVEGIGDDATAQSRYRVGYAHYTEGKRAFTGAMVAYEDNEWMPSNHEFTRAAEEFDAAREEFNTAVRFGEDATAVTYFERAEQKAEALWRAADWLSDSASEFASGEGRTGESLRNDAETPLETARAIHDPPDPDEFPPEQDPAEAGDLGPSDDDTETAFELDESALEGDRSEGASAGEQSGAAVSADGSAGSSAATATDSSEAASPNSQAPASGDTAEEASEQPDESTAIDDAELEAITAELEQQSATDSTADSERTTATDGAVEPDAETIDGDLDSDDLELDLTDPTEGSDGWEDDGDGNECDADGDESEPDDGSEGDDETTAEFGGLGSGDSGVPDSL